MGAAVYDGVLVLAVWFLATAVLLPFTGGQAIAAGTWWFAPYLIAVSFLYFGGFWVHGGQTLGMRAWKLRLRGLDGDSVGWAAAAIRYVGAIASWLALGLGFWWAGVDARKLSWHDRLSRSALWIEEPS